MEKAKFKARNFDKQKFEKKRFQKEERKSASSRVQQVPFNLTTDERSKSRVRKSIESTGSKDEKSFKAKAMPAYKFFEPNSGEIKQKTTEIQGFNLKTDERSLSKSQSLKSNVSEDSAGFKARKMPDFNCSNQLNGVAIQPPKKLTQSEPFSFNSDSRGADRVRKLKQLKEKEEEELLK